MTELAAVVLLALLMFALVWFVLLPAVRKLENEIDGMEIVDAISQEPNA